MIKVILSGLGNTGIEILKCIKETEGVDLSCVVSEFNLKDESYKVYKKFKDIKEKADVIIYFSKPSRIDEILDYAINNEMPIVIGTTGYTEEQNEKILKASKLIPVFKSSNTSTGITVMLKLIKIATKLLDGFDIEVIEKHPNRKTDCPCGTAYMTADVIKEVRYELENIYGREGINCSRQKNELGIHTIRGGTIIGENDVIFAGEDEVLEIKHRASSNIIFAKGAVIASKYLIDKPPGYYDMNDILTIE